MAKFDPHRMKTPKLIATLTFGDVLLSNITFLIFAVFDVQLTMSPLTFV